MLPRITSAARTRGLWNSDAGETSTVEPVARRKRDRRLKRRVLAERRIDLSE